MGRALARIFGLKPKLLPMRTRRPFAVLALRLRPPEILRRRAIELPARSRRETPIATMRRDESRTRAILRSTLIHLLPRRKRSAVGTAAIKLRALLRRRHRRAHFVSAAAKILRPFAARCGAEVVHHAARMPPHPVGTLRHPRIAGAAEIGTIPLLHPRRKSPALPVATAIRLAFAVRIAIGPSLLSLRTIGVRGAVFASLIVRAIRLRALIPAVLAAELPVVRTRVPLLRSIGPARAVFALGRVFRTLGCIVLGAERPRGKRERGCGDEDRS